MNFYIVGGAVRDKLLGKEPKDIDYVVVGATPQDMLDLGYSQVGADFPVFLHPETGDEYALARTERKNGRGYHGFAVDFSPSTTLVEDLERRDLTMNAMAMLEGSDIVVDPFGGQEDLKNKVLRHVSAAFADDPLRVIRLGRFAARYSDFTVAQETLNLSIQMANNGDLDDLPHERFWAELTKVFSERDVELFFLFLHNVGADVNTTFFEGLYGDLRGKAMRDMILYTNVVLSSVPEEDRLMIHTALTALPSSTTIETATSDTKALWKLVQKVRPILAGGVTADLATKLHGLFKSSRAWSEGSMFTHLITAMRVEVAVKETPFEDFVALLEDAHAVSKAITAEQFIGKFEGKALGEAIDDARIKAISAL